MQSFMNICFAVTGIIFIYALSTRLVEFVMCKLWEKIDDNPKPWKARVFAAIEIPGLLYIAPVSLLMLSVDEWLEAIIEAINDTIRHLKGEWR